MNIIANVDKRIFVEYFRGTLQYLYERRDAIREHTGHDVSNHFLEDLVARAVGEFMYMMVTFNDEDPTKFWDEVFHEYLMADVFTDDVVLFGTIVCGEMVRFVPYVRPQLQVIGRRILNQDHELEMVMTLYFEGSTMVSFVFQGVPEHVGAYENVTASAIL